MKKTIRAAVLFLFLAASQLWAQLPATVFPLKIEAFCLKVKLNPPEASLFGEMFLEVDYDQSTGKTAQLLLDKKLEILELVRIENGVKPEKLNCRRENLFLNLPDLAGGKSRLKIVYQGKFLGAGGEKRTTKSCLTPEFGQLFSDTYWYPWSHWVSFNQLKEGLLELSLPPEYNLIANGLQVKEEVKAGEKISAWQIKGEVLRRGGAFNLFYSRQHKIYSREIGGINYQFFLKPEEARLTEMLFNRLPQIVNFYSSNFYPYPYGKFALVTSGLYPPRLGVGKYTEFMVISSEVFTIYAQQGRPEQEGGGGGGGLFYFLSHEAAHQWWGNLIGEFPSMLFAEGMPQLFAGLLMEKMQGERGLNLLKRKFLTELKQFFAARGEDFPLAEDTLPNYQEKEKMMEAAESLQKYKFPLYMLKLRDKIGDLNFLLGLRDFTAKNVGSFIPGVESLEAAFAGYLTEEQKACLRELLRVKWQNFEELEQFLEK